MGGRVPARIAAVFVLVVSYGALSARQPAVRTSMPLPSTARQVAAALGLDPTDRSQLPNALVRLVFESPDGAGTNAQKRRTALLSQLKGPSSEPPIWVPLPLDTSIWRETLLDHPVKNVDLAASILSDRSTALLYQGLSALDDDTLGWLGPDRETLLHLRRNAAIFAAFGRSLKIRGGRVSVPGGSGADPIWAAIVGADPERPSIFVQRLFRGSGRLAWFYDTIQHLDREHQKLVYGDDETESVRIERTRELLDVFESAAPEWQVADRPFVRPALAPSVVVSLAAVNGNGAFVGPRSRRVWELAFRARSGDAVSVDPGSETTPDRSVEPSWLARRIALVPAHIGRTRLEIFLFAQRVFPGRRAEEAALIGALRGAIAFPALALTLERIGVTEASAYVAAARTASALNAIRSAEWRTVAITEFQASLAIVDRAVRKGALDRESAVELTSSLVALPVSPTQGYGDAFAQWLRQHVVAFVDQEELNVTLDSQLAALAAAPSDGARLTLEQAVADTLTAIVFASRSGQQDGRARADIAAPSNLGLSDNTSGSAWQLPREEYGRQGPRRVTSSLLGLDATLGHLAVRTSPTDSRP